MRIREDNTRAYFDLIHSVHQSMSNSPLKQTFQHIKGHQDTQTRYINLSCQAQMNFKANLLA